MDRIVVTENLSERRKVADFQTEVEILVDQPLFDEIDPNYAPNMVGFGIGKEFWSIVPVRSVMDKDVAASHSHTPDL